MKDNPARNSLSTINGDNTINDKVFSVKELQDLIKLINSNLSQKQIDEIVDELEVKQNQQIKLDNLISKSKEKRRSSKFADFYGCFLNYFITPSERIGQILEESKNKLAEFMEYKLVEDLEWVIKKINSEDLYSLYFENLLREESHLLKGKDKNLDIEGTLNFISEYSKDNFNKNKKNDVMKARRLSNKKMNMHFKRSTTIDSIKNIFPAEVIQAHSFKKKRSSIDFLNVDSILNPGDNLLIMRKITEDERENEKSQMQIVLNKNISVNEKIDEIAADEEAPEYVSENEKNYDSVECIKHEAPNFINESDTKKDTSLEGVDINNSNDIYSSQGEDCFDEEESNKDEDEEIVKENALFNGLDIQNNQQTNIIHQLEVEDFNIFEFAQKFGRQNVLREISLSIFLRHSLFCLINQERFETFLDKIRVGYDYLLPYHNELHAADVLQTSNLFYKFCNLNRQIDLTSLDLSGYLIAAIIHDYRHPGLNNNYHINKRSPISIKYNDVSVLENFHVSSAFKIISHPNSNIFTDLGVEEYRVVRKRIVECVLATDMAKHTKSQISLKIKVDRLAKVSNENILNRFYTDANEDSIFDRQQEILSFFIHCADISNPGKKFPISKIWTNLVVEEFFMQGDLEKKENLPVSFLCDRNTTNIPKSQVLFITNIVLPSFKILSQFSSNFDNMVKNMYDNIEEWKKEESQKII